MVKRIITFGKVNSSEYGALVDGSESYGVAERDYTTVTIPGRDGELTLDNGRYKNMQVKYTMKFSDVNKMSQLMSAYAIMVGYQQLVDNMRPDEYRLARLTGALVPKMSGIGNGHGELAVTFDCKPQIFLVSGDTAITLSETGSVTNPTGMTARPLIRVYGAGELRVGATIITISAHEQEYVDIDCDAMDCAYDSVNLNGKVTLSAFPVLGAGETNITLGDGITKIEIYPRWWKL